MLNSWRGRWREGDAQTNTNRCLADVEKRGQVWGSSLCDCHRNRRSRYNRHLQRQQQGISPNVFQFCMWKKPRGELTDVHSVSSKQFLSFVAAWTSRLWSRPWVSLDATLLCCWQSGWVANVWTPMVSCCWAQPLQGRPLRGCLYLRLTFCNLLLGSY